jgi:rRNA maturation endonuclease Nob1
MNAFIIEVRTAYALLCIIRYKFLFERVDPVDACPDCGKQTVREATEQERGEFRKGRAEAHGAHTEE